MSEHHFLYSHNLIFKTIDVVEYFDIDNIVYVGLPPENVFRYVRQLWWCEIVDYFNIDYTIVEIFQPWAEDLKNEGWNVVWSDVKDYVPESENSLLIWSHGPEHIEKEQFSNILPTLLDRYVNVVIAMPYGIWEQTSAVNPYEEHKWHAYPEDLERLGFEYVVTNGPKDNKGDLIGVYYDY